MTLPLFLGVSHLPQALLTAFLFTLAFYPRLALVGLIILFPLLTLPSLRQVRDLLQDYWISAPGHFKPHLKRTRWSPEGQDGLGRLQTPKGQKRRLVLVTGADGGVGFETSVALLLAGCDVLMGVKDFELPGHWNRIQERLDPRIVDGMVKQRQDTNTSADDSAQMKSIGQALPFKCDFSDMRGARLAAQQVWRIAAERNTDGFPASMVGAITHYIGTVGVGFDRPTPDGTLVCRYSENDDGIEYQLGVNAINPFVFTLLVWPLVARACRAEDQPVVDGRILLTNSIAHAWNTLPLAIAPRYESWQSVKRQGEKRWNAGRYNFSKLTQLLLITSLEGISPSLLSSLHGLVDLPAQPASPTLLSLHPGEVNTPFLDLMLPSWRCTWIERMTCLTPLQGAWTGLWGCVVDLTCAKRAPLTLSTSSNPVESSWPASQADESSKPSVGYYYLMSLCTFGKPCSLARDARLIKECWALVGSKLVSFFEGNKEEVLEAECLSLNFHSWEKQVEQVIANA